jgi:hypothetical protein
MENVGVCLYAGYGTWRPGWWGGCGVQLYYVVRERRQQPPTWAILWLSLPDEPVLRAILCTHGEY